MDTEITSRVFLAMQTMDISVLKTFPKNEIRKILPSLVRMSLLTHIQNTKSKMDLRREVLSLLVEIEVVNNIVQYLQVNYNELEIELKKEQMQRQKLGITDFQQQQQSYGLQSGIALGFERAELARKVKAVLSQIFLIQCQISEYNINQNGNKELILKCSELFDDGIYLDEITDIICIALAELPSLFTIQEVVETLVYVNNGSCIICAVIANFPDCYKDVITYFITNCDEESFDGKLKLEVLNSLIELNPRQALTTRSLCVDLMKVPSLLLKLSLKDPQDLIGFLSGLLLGNDQVLRNWFALYIKTSQKRKNDLLQSVREELLKQLQAILTKLTDEDNTVQASALLRLYCALRGIAGIKFNDDELYSILLLITSKPAPTASGIRFVSLGLSMLIACSSLISQNYLEQKAIEWMQWLVKEETYFENKIGSEGSLGEMLLLIAIHFHSNQISAIAELVCSNLAMKIPIRPNNTTRIKQIFIQELFTEQIVAAHAVKVPVTFNLNANIPGYLPVHCIHQLLKSRAFLKHKVTIKSWIYKQICSCTTPLHPVMPILIEVFVNSLILPGKLGTGGIVANVSIEHLHKPLTEDEILQVFQNKTEKNTNIYSNEMEVDSTGLRDFVKKSSLTSQLLLLYYLVLYEDVRQSNMVTIIQSGRNLKHYSAEFMSELPIKYLLQQVQQKQDQYTSLFHPLLRLLITHFPHLSLVDDWIEESKISNNKVYSVKDLNEKQILQAFEDIHSNPSKLMNILTVMSEISPTELWKFAELIIDNFNLIIMSRVPKLIQELYRKVWLRLNSVLPRRLWTMTVNTILPKELLTTSLTNYTNESSLLDPLQILRCQDNIFRSPDGLLIVLRILQASLAASKTQLTRHIQEKPLFDKDGQIQSEEEREQLKTSLVALQESAAVQILLEVCLSSENDLSNYGEFWALREIRGIICSYIHQSFISEPSLVKLVHFQTYQNELLRITVNGIPSMHICIDFLAEILNIPEMEKQIFTIDLTSHLALKYAIPKGLSTSKLCLNTLSTLVGLLTSDARIEMFRSTLPVIPRFAEAFPILVDECINFLMQLGRILHTQKALGRNSFPIPPLALHPGSKSKTKAMYAQYSDDLLLEVRQTFLDVLLKTISNIRIY